MIGIYLEITVKIELWHSITLGDQEVIYFWGTEFFDEEQKWILARKIERQNDISKI